MKKYYILFFFFLSNIVQAQYFDWNEILYSMTSQGGLTWYNDLHVATNGSQIIRYTIKPCLLCDPETIESTIDAAGNVTGTHNTYWNGYRDSYFDRFGNVIQITKSGSDYLLNYNLPASVNILLNDTVPDFADGDYMKNLYLFYNNGFSTRINIYDSTAAFVKTLLLPGNIYKLSFTGELFMCETNLLQNTAIVKKYDSSGNFIKDYPFSLFPDLSLSPPCFAVTKYGNMIWGVLNNNVVCYDSSGALTFSIPLIDNRHVSMAVDEAGNLYIWEGNNIYKYSQTTVEWQTMVDAALTEKIQLDETGSIYYLCNYTEPLFSNSNGSFIPTSYYLPPSVVFKGYSIDPGPVAGTNSNIVCGKLNSAPAPAFNIYITAALQNQLPATTFCSGTFFDIRVNYDHLPVTDAADTVYIEISDPSGSFNSAQVIGKGTGLLIQCSFSDQIPAGNSYLIRARLGNTVLVSTPYAQQITVNTTPEALLLLENSLEGSYACQPYTFKTNPEPGLTYDWFSITDPFFNPIYNHFSVNDSIITLPVNGYEAIGVNITSNISGCTVTSSILTPEEIDSVNPPDLRIFIPDTLHINDVAVEVHTPGYLEGVVSGQGIYPDGLNNGKYYFYPDSVNPGLIPITRQLSHLGTPCVPYEKTEYIYIDTLPRNIVCGDIDPVDKTLCVGDSVSVPFSLLNPAIYNASNIFIVELCSEDAGNGKITWLADIGSGAVSPIICIVPGYRGNRLRFRIRSGQTQEISTLNANGPITVPVNPYAQFQENIVTTGCYPVNIPLNIYSSYGQHQWFFNDTLKIDSTDWNVGIQPSQAGVYRLTVTDPDNGCIAKFGPVTVNDSAHIPTLITDPSAYYLYSCGKTFPLITAHTDSLSVINWYFQDNLLPAVGDSLFTFHQGAYKAVASCNQGCLISVFNQKYVYADPLIALDEPDTTVLVNGSSILLSVNNDYPFFSYGYQWIKNGSVPVAQTRQVVVTDSGFYFVIVSSTSGCSDTSETIYITATNNTVPVITHGEKTPAAFFHLQPNPGNGNFTLIGRNFNDKNILLYISDPYGRLLYKKNINAINGKIDEGFELKSITDGLYFVSLETANQAVSMPLVIVH